MAFNATYISEIGAQLNPYTYAVTDNLGNIIEEKWDHGLKNLITATSIRMAKKTADATSFVGVTEATNVNIDCYVTDSRFVLACKKYQKGGGWVGFDAGGILTALTLNAGSKIIANATSKGKIFLGQIRYEWLYFIGYRRSINWRSEATLQICYRDTQKTIWMMTLAFKNGSDTALVANEVLHRAAKYRLDMNDEKSEKELMFLQKYVAGAKIVPDNNPKNVSSVLFPCPYFAPNGETKRPNWQ